MLPLMVAHPHSGWQVARTAAAAAAAAVAVAVAAWEGRTWIDAREEVLGVPFGTMRRGSRRWSDDVDGIAWPRSMGIHTELEWVAVVRCQHLEDDVACQSV